MIAISPEAMKAARELTEELGPIPERLWPQILASALVAWGQAAVDAEREACARICAAERNARGQDADSFSHYEGEEAAINSDKCYVACSTADRLASLIRARQQRTEGDAK